MNSDRTLHCMVNLKSWALGYPIEFWTSPLVTDLQAMLVGELNPQAKYDQTRTLLSASVDPPMVGTYISGGQVREAKDMESFPPECILAEGIPASWLVSGTNYVNLAKRRVAQMFANKIAAEVSQRGSSLVFVDNIVHRSADAKWFPWSATCAFLSFLRERLQFKKMKIIANVAVAPFAMSDEDVKLLGDSVDGMLFEMPFTLDARGDAAKTNRLISVYRRWLDAGKIVVLIPVDPLVGRYTDAEARMIAGFAAAVRRPGDALFVSHVFYNPIPAWSAWPEQLGEPLAGVDVTPSGVVSRLCRGGRMVVDPVKREATIYRLSRLSSGGKIARTASGR